MYSIQIQVSKRPALQGIPVSVMLKTECSILLLESKRQFNQSHSFQRSGRSIDYANIFWIMRPRSSLLRYKNNVDYQCLTTDLTLPSPLPYFFYNLKHFFLLEPLCWCKALPAPLGPSLNSE
jgi:hypothetical protein